MPTDIPTLSLATHLVTQLEQLDQADSALRTIYRQLAENPDAAPEYETALRELHRKRLELAQQVGVAALAEWRTARAVVETRSTRGAGTLTEQLFTEPSTNGVPAMATPAPSTLTLNRWPGQGVIRARSSFLRGLGFFGLLEES
jgi:hypothetical protein